MEVRAMEVEVDMGQDEKLSIRSPEEAIGIFQMKVLAKLPDWKERLGTDPLSMARARKGVRNVSGTVVRSLLMHCQ